MLAISALSLVLIDNVVSLDRSRYRSAPWMLVRIPTRALALSQEWRLWSTPLRNRYYVFDACLEDGSVFDLHTGEALDWDHPRRASRNNHWWKYQLMLSRPARDRLRAGYADYLIRDWNSSHAPGRGVASLAIVMIDASRGGEPISTLPREILWRGGRRSSGCRP